MNQNAVRPEGGEEDMDEKEYFVNGVFDYCRKYNYDAHQRAVEDELPMDRSDMDSTLQELRKNFYQTRQTFDIEFRKAQLRRLVEGLNKYKDEICEALEFDVGKTGFDALNEMIGAEWACKHDIAGVDEWQKSQPVDTPIMLSPGTSYIKPEPLGVVAVISAWNYPVLLMISPVAQAIIAGNCVIAKPSELAPRTSHMIKKLFDECLDPRFYRCIEGRLAVSIKLTTMRVDKIIFTGSTATGRLVSQAASKNLVPCILELGGKSPCVIDTSANLKVAANKVLMARFSNAGQTCIAVDYVLIHESQADEFIALMKSEITDGLNEMKDVSTCGRVVSKGHYERICGLLEDHGGEVVHGNPDAHKDKWLRPTIVMNPDDNSKLMQEEIFGPVLPVKTYRDQDEVINYLNGREKPLAMYYFGDKSSNFARRLMEETSAGGFTINDVIVQVVNQNAPFGGVGESGYGRYHGKAGFVELSNMKGVLVRPILDFAPFNWMTFPFKEDVKKQMLDGKNYVNSVTTRQLANGCWCCCGFCLFAIAAIFFGIYFNEIFGLSTEETVITNIA